MTAAGRVLILLAALAASASLVAQSKVGPTQIMMAEQTIDLTKALAKFPGILGDIQSKPDAPKTPLKPAILVEDKNHPPYELTLMRFITDKFPPIAITPQGLKATLIGAAKFVDGLTAEQRKLLESSGESVGRIERKRADGTHQHIGTGFVAKNRHVLTNCHVMQSIANKANGDWTLGSGDNVFINFAADGSHTPANEFLLNGIAKYPSTAGLDAALLSVASQSTDASRQLPPDLRLRAARGTSAYVADEIFVIGYPALGGYSALLPSTDPFGQLGAQKVSKVASPGVIAGMNGTHGFDVLLHLASTFKGQSGSPVVDKTEGEVVGIHSCCTAPAPPKTTFTVNDPPCSSMLFADVENQAIASWAIGNVAALPGPKTLFPRPRR